MNVQRKTFFVPNLSIKGMLILSMQIKQPSNMKELSIANFWGKSRNKSFYEICNGENEVICYFHVRLIGAQNLFEIEREKCAL